MSANSTVNDLFGINEDVYDSSYEILAWDDLEIDPNLLRGIYAYGFEKPSPIQQKAIKPLILKKDIVAQAQSGTGKTATFTIGALANVDITDNSTQILVLSPTKELTTQTAKVFAGLGGMLDGLRIKTVYGGSAFEESSSFSNKTVPHVICGCPGRVYDMMRRDKINSRKIKLVILDEADAITQSAQKMLKQIIEKYTGNARFCLICNCIKSINTALQSRCVMYNFSPLELSSVNNKIITISKELNINITKDGIEKIWKLSNGDMRKVLHMFQVISIGNKNIDSKLVSSFKKYPYENDIEELYKIFMKNNLKLSLNYLETFIKDNNYYLSDIISEITLLIVKNIIDKKIKNMKAIKLIKNIRECENNIITTTDTTIQIFSFVSIFSL